MQNIETIENELIAINNEIINALESGNEISILLDRKYELLNKKYRSLSISRD